ncbi:MAG: type III secretion system cytoplasmic ring protein SctQ [Deltaproteobacteria bacterium]|jgi:type III secretion system YscQ/HrcQ family protein|nr:type III secretion system cytoplasmic ring protein SctQ [Deltaproteobacteria bacterium]
MNNTLIAAWPQNLARLNNRLAGRDIAVQMPCAASGQTFMLRPEPGGLVFPCPNRFVQETAAGQADSTTDFMLEADGEAWQIRVWGRAAEDLLSPSHTVAGLNAEDIPAELKPALLALALEPLLDQAGQASGHRFHLAWATESAQKSVVAKEYFLLPFSLSDSAGNPAGAGEVIIPLSAAALSLLADLAKKFPRRSSQNGLGQSAYALPVCLSLCAGREAFPLSLLREVEPGDVLRFACPAKPALTLEALNRPLWKASLIEGQIIIEGRLNKISEEAAMSATPENIGASAAESEISGLKAPVIKAAEPKESGLSMADIDSLEIMLTLELDERRITIGELAALGPGQILASTASLDSPITIKAGGKAVGKGRLVEVGDNLGVLISCLNLDEPGGGDLNRPDKTGEQSWSKNAI